MSVVNSLISQRSVRKNSSSEMEIDSFSLRLAGEFCSGLTKERETVEEAKKFIEEMGEYIFGKASGSDANTEEMVAIAKGLDPLVGVELLLAVHYTGKASELTSAEFLESLNALDNYIASSLLYEMQITGNVSALSDSRMFSDNATNFFNKLGYEAASEWFYSIAKTGDVENLTSSTVLNEKVLSLINEDSRISSELSYAIGETGKVDALTDGKFLDALKGLEPVMAAEFLSAVWCVGEGANLASAEMVSRLGGTETDVWKEMARVNYGFAGQGEKIIISNFGDGHDRGSKMLMRDLISQGFDVIYVGEMQDYRDIARVAQTERAGAVGFGLMGSVHSEIVTDTLSELKILGLKDVQVFGGGFVEAETAIKFEDKGIRFFAPGTKTGDIELFLREMQAGQRYLESGSAVILHSYQSTNMPFGMNWTVDASKFAQTPQIQTLGSDYTGAQQNYWIRILQMALPYSIQFQDMPAQSRKESGGQDEQHGEVLEIEEYDMASPATEILKRTIKAKGTDKKIKAKPALRIPNRDILIPKTEMEVIRAISTDSGARMALFRAHEQTHKHFTKRLDVRSDESNMPSGAVIRDKPNRMKTLQEADTRGVRSKALPLTFGRNTTKTSLDNRALNLPKKDRTVRNVANKEGYKNDGTANRIMHSAEVKTRGLEAQDKGAKVENKAPRRIKLPKELSSASEKDGFEIKIERERKFLPEPADVPDLSGYNHALFTQSYVKDRDSGDWIRARKVDFGNRSEYFITIKKFVPGGSKAYERIEAEREITKEQFEMLNRLADGKTLTKTRYWIPYEGKTIDFDVYHDAEGSKKLSGMVTAEVEFDSMEELNKFVPPKWFGKEVSADNRYRSRKLAKNGKPVVEEVRGMLRK